MINKTLKIIPVIASLLLCCSCSAKNADKEVGFLNYKYKLDRVGDIHGLPPNEGVRIDWMEGVTFYTDIFDLGSSYLNFECKGTSYDDFHCETSLHIVGKNGDIIFDETNFYTEYNDKQIGEVTLLDENVKKRVGRIYYSIFRIRWQYEYAVKADTTPVLLTFEFTKLSFNPLPDFLK